MNNYWIQLRNRFVVERYILADNAIDKTAAETALIARVWEVGPIMSASHLFTPYDYDDPDKHIVYLKGGSLDDFHLAKKEWLAWKDGR